MFHTMKRFISDDRGISAIEYGLLAAVVALVMVAGAKILGTNLSLLLGTTVGASM